MKCMGNALIYYLPSLFSNIPVSTHRYCKMRFCVIYKNLYSYISERGIPAHKSALSTTCLYAFISAANASPCLLCTELFSTKFCLSWYDFSAVLSSC